MNEREVEALNKTGTFRKLPIDGGLEETHISWVIVGKKNVFKIKKPLKLSFLDFSSLARRKKYCERELYLNQRFSPIYLNVLPVRRDNNRWNIGESAGTIVDYVVHMKRLSSTKRMDKLLKAKKVTSKHIGSLAKVISSFHRNAKRVRKPFHLRTAQEDFNDVGSVSRLARKYIGVDAANVIKESISWSNTFLKRHQGRIAERINSGFYRDLHGDLHSGNIFLYAKPILFDCIEFNDSYRQIDLINEIAFFCMDLEAFGRMGLSQHFLKEYQRRSNCFQTDEDYLLMKYYKCYRANVRAKVHALSADQSRCEEKTFENHVSECRKYLRLMKTYMQQSR